MNCYYCNYPLRNPESLVCSECGRSSDPETVADFLQGRYRWIVTIGMIAWLSFASANILFYYDLWSQLFFLPSLIRLLLTAVGLGVAISVALSFLRSRKPLMAGALVITIAAVAIGSWTDQADKISVRSRLWRYQTSYERQVQTVLSGTRPSRVIWTSTNIVDPGPPIRVAFSWGGLVDNWIGIVYDPTGDVLKANQFKDDWSNWDDPKLAPIKKLFGGDMINAEHLWGDWYLCGFT